MIYINEFWGSLCILTFYSIFVSEVGAAGGGGGQDDRVPVPGAAHAGLPRRAARRAGAPP